MTLATHDKTRYPYLGAMHDTKMSEVQSYCIIIFYRHNYNTLLYNTPKIDHATISPQYSNYESQKLVKS